MSQPSSVDLDVSEKLKDADFRKSFFLAESSAKIAQQLIQLRRRRGLTQTQVANLAGTKQPAVSRAERADYQNWSFSALRSLADALDARLRVTIEATEDVLWEYRAELGKSGGRGSRLSDQSSADSVSPVQPARVLISTSETGQMQDHLLPYAQRSLGLLKDEAHGIGGNRQ
jgi:transcriptional regulator with XRE-family HTH domain